MQTAALLISLQWHTEGDHPPWLLRGLTGYLDSCTHLPGLLLYSLGLKQIKQIHCIRIAYCITDNWSLTRPARFFFFTSHRFIAVIHPACLSEPVPWNYSCFWSPTQCLRDTLGTKATRHWVCISFVQLFCWKKPCQNSRWHTSVLS